MKIKLVKEHLNEKKQEKHTMESLSYEFIRDILKLGSSENIFDKFLNKKEIDLSQSTDFINAVIERIKKRWL